MTSPMYCRNREARRILDTPGRAVGTEYAARAVGARMVRGIVKKSSAVLDHHPLAGKRDSRAAGAAGGSSQPAAPDR